LKRYRKIFTGWLILFVFSCAAGCTDQKPVDSITRSLAPEHTSIPLSTSAPVETIQMALPVTATATETTGQTTCAYQWATQPLPDIAKHLQIELEKAELAQIVLFAEAFGENCIDPTTNEVKRFLTMQTDFRITAPVISLQDETELGQLLEKTLQVFASYSAGSFPGANLGDVEFTFTMENEKRILRFPLKAGIDAYNLGLKGAELLMALSNPV